jgi:hypothetical protein
MARVPVWSVKGDVAMVWGGLRRDCRGARRFDSGVRPLEFMVVRLV